MGKIRRIDFSPDEWLVGAASLKLAERGAYITICALIYSHGGPILDDAKELAAMCRTSPAKWTAIRDELVRRGKVESADGKLTVLRCEEEIARASGRMEKWAEKGREGGLKSSENRRNSVGLRSKRDPVNAKNSQNEVPVSKENNDLAQGTLENTFNPTTNYQPPYPIADAIGAGPTAEIIPPSMPTDPAAILFQVARSILPHHGVAASRVGALIGKWRKQGVTDIELQGLITEAGSMRRDNITAYIEGSIRSRANGSGRSPGARHGGGRAQPLSADERREILCDTDLGEGLGARHGGFGFLDGD